VRDLVDHHVALAPPAPMAGFRYRRQKLNIH
jgi:hypothetical protein